MADEGIVMKCIVTDKMRVTGKGWVLIIDAAPDRLAIGRKMRCTNKDFQYTVSGFGGLSNMEKKELILSPNCAIGSEVQVGDVLEMIDEQKELL